MSTEYSRKLHTILWGLFAIWAVVFILLYPEISLDASVKGLSLWWKWVFPALLPFFVFAEISLGLGLIHGIGKLLEPFMRKSFRLPGAASLALVSGLVAGFPAGAQSTAQLYAKGLLTHKESERLLLLSHVCHPVIIIHVVAVGFFQDVRLGYIWMIMHYLGLLALAITIRLGNSHFQKQETATSHFTWDEFLNTIHQAKQADGRSIGQLLGDAVQHAVQTLFKLGGLIMICAVLLELSATLITHPNIVLLLSAFTDVHLGAYSIQNSHLPYFVQIVSMSALFAWSGLSAYAQTEATLHGSGLKLRGFFRARMVHGLYAAGFTALCWPWIKSFIQVQQSVLTVPTFSAARTIQVPTWQAWTTVWNFGMFTFGIVIFALCLMAFWSKVRSR